MRSRLQIGGHPVHPMLVHYPIGLFSAALLFDFAYLWQHDPLWYWLAFYDMLLGYIAAVAAAVAGAVDFFLAVPPEPRVCRPAAVHGLLGVLVLLLYSVNLGLRLDEAAAEGSTLWGAVGLSVAGMTVLTVGAWFGGKLVYIHRVGVQN